MRMMGCLNRRNGRTCRHPELTDLAIVSLITPRESGNDAGLVLRSWVS